MSKKITTAPQEKISHPMILAFTSVLWVLVALFLILPKGYATNTVDILTPDQVGIGKPFLVRITSQYPLEKVSVSWSGKTVATSVTKEGGLFTAMVILGVGLKNELGATPLDVAVTRQGSTQQFHKSVAIVDTVFLSETLTLAPSLVTPPKKITARIQRERKASLEALNTISFLRHWVFPFSRPVEGKMLSRFGLHRVFNGETKRRHKGLDFRAWEGTPIHSMATGHVILVGSFYFAGNCVFIDHGNGLVSLSCHMSKVLVKKGDMVVSGQKIGLSGATGRVNGAHLHLSVYSLGQAIDPEAFFDGALGGGA